MVGGANNLDNDKIEVVLNKTLKSLNRPDILIEESRASTQSFHDFINKRKETGIDPSIDLFDPLSQSNTNLQKIDDLYDVIIPVDTEEEGSANARNRFTSY
jgi:hypothetical protein